MPSPAYLVRVPVEIWPSRSDWQATVVSVSKSVGDMVKAGDVVAEVELEKVVVEVESPVSGRVSRVHVRVGDKVKPGDPILEVEAT